MAQKQIKKVLRLACEEIELWFGAFNKGKHALAALAALEERQRQLLDLEPNDEALGVLRDHDGAQMWLLKRHIDEIARHHTIVRSQKKQLGYSLLRLEDCVNQLTKLSAELDDPAQACARSYAEPVSISDALQWSRYCFRELSLWEVKITPEFWKIPESEEAVKVVKEKLADIYFKVIESSGK